MAEATGALITYNVTSNREDLTDDIYLIDPTETPIFSRIPDVDATNTNHEWQTEALAAAVDTNAHIEGEDFTGEASIPTVRPRNICQILKKEPVVSGTQQAANHAGINDMMDHQVFKRMEEIKRDIEKSFTANKGLVVGSSSTARVMRGLPSWLTTNTNRGAGTSTGDIGADASAETVGATDATITRAFTEVILKDVEKQCYDSGGKPDMLVVGSANKQTVAGFTGRSSARQMVGEATIQANVDIYAGNFFQLEVVPDRFMRSRDAFLIQTDLLATAFYRRIGNEQIGKQGDNIKSQVVGELTLEVRNESAHGVAADLS